MENHTLAQRICAKVDAWSKSGTLDADQFEAELSYFRGRYFADGAPTGHFADLGLREHDHPEIVRTVIEDKHDNPRDRMLALLMVVWSCATISFKCKVGLRAARPS